MFVAYYQSPVPSTECPVFFLSTQHRAFGIQYSVLPFPYLLMNTPMADMVSIKIVFIAKRFLFKKIDKNTGTVPDNVKPYLKLVF